MVLKDEWDRLDAETREWLLNNPGRVLVPFAFTTAIQKLSAGHIDVDAHGQMILSGEDLDFIREKGTGMGSRQPSGQFQFFESAHPEQHH